MNFNNLLQKEKQIAEDHQATYEKQNDEIDEKVRQTKGMHDEIVAQQSRIAPQNKDLIFQKNRLY